MAIAPKVSRSGSGNRARRSNNSKNSKWKKGMKGTPKESSENMIDSPWKPGHVTFKNMTPYHLRQFAIIPEDSKQTKYPKKAGRYGVDGFYFKGGPSKNHWWKIPDHCETIVTGKGKTFENTSFSFDNKINLFGLQAAAATFKKLVPGYVTEDSENHKMPHGWKW